ncbi:Retrovirus-related Pol Polyprotein from transposon 17.6 [Phytophthora megakarya]|uniref:Retrovirus-related Pol Polyprotein from transposon 17.6 n=1 Tax=Phytophthora megakarya TaxID=4795 RepID=A0A225V549_9STRA|nr:Retrovirus-related Pol Polyprotein from transposon 17.6 [Phytophthora megakarya]
MEYVGHELGSDGVRPLQRLVDAVRGFPKPQDVTEVKRFVHLAGYYEGFGSLMAPLTKLLRRTAEWEWGDAQQAAFEHVKEHLTNKPLLIYPNFQLPFMVVTNASKIGFGACLMQGHGAGWPPGAYASKVNNETEAKYGITELELATVVWSIKLFRSYLYGRRFTIVTDHVALKWLMTSTNLTGKLHRWALTLQEFDFDVKYRPGSTNVVADALSRAPTAKALTAIGRRCRAHRQAADRAQIAVELARAKAVQLNGAATRHARTRRGVRGRRRRRARERGNSGGGHAVQDAVARERHAAIIRAHRERRGAVPGRRKGLKKLLRKGEALRRAEGETTEVQAIYEIDTGDDGVSSCTD